jgi:hypothetical protein
MPPSRWVHPTAGETRQEGASPIRVKSDPRPSGSAGPRRSVKEPSVAEAHLGQYMPKSADLSEYPRADLKRIHDSPNERPRKTLGLLKRVWRRVL